MPSKRFDLTKLVLGIRFVYVNRPLAGLPLPLGYVSVRMAADSTPFVWWVGVVCGSIRKYAADTEIYIYIFEVGFELEGSTETRLYVNFERVQQSKGAQST